METWGPSFRIWSSIELVRIFKSKSRKSTINPYGEQIVVVGGGNTAMDCARAATTLPGVKSLSGLSSE